MILLTIPTGAASMFSSLQDVKSALFLLGYTVDMKQVENDLLQDGFFNKVVEETEESFKEISIQYA